MSVSVFQSSSGQKAGCNTANSLRMSLALILFQSSSGQKAGCNPSLPSRKSSPRKMFQSSSGQKAGCNPVERRGRPPSHLCFNPHPARRPDATILRPPGSPLGFNPHPARRPDDIVSILIRPEGRMQRRYLNFLSVLREPPDAGLPICFHRSDHFFSSSYDPATNANLQAAMVPALGSRQTTSGPVKSITSLLPYSSTSLSRLPGSL